MSRHVFVLGAGASAAAGAPVSSNFMGKAQQLLRSQRLQGKDLDAFTLVFEAREALKAVHSKAVLNLDDLETLFNAFEMAALFNRLGPLSEEKVQGLPAAMRRVIARTIEANLVFRTEPIHDSLPKILPPHPYERFGELLSDISDRHRWPDICLITFNYDVAIDYTLHFKRIPFSYCLEDDSKGRYGIDFLKLHGSLNWRRCAECGLVIPWPIQAALNSRQWPFADEIRLDLSLQYPQEQHCGKQLISEPTIVPPTWNKGSYYSQLERVWRRAASHLAQAESIFIIGYSYPPTDEFFKYLYALGSIGDGWLERIYVFNPDPTASERIKLLLGPLATGKYRGFQSSFEDAISSLRKSGLM